MSCYTLANKTCPSVSIVVLRGTQKAQKKILLLFWLTLLCNGVLSWAGLHRENDLNLKGLPG